MLWKQDESATAKIHTRNKDACTLILLQRSKFPHTSAAFRILEFSSVKHLSEIRTWMCQYHTPAENICFLHTVGEDGRRPNEVIHRKVKQVHWCSTDADNAVPKRAGLSNLNHAVTGLSLQVGYTDSAISLPWFFSLCFFLFLSRSNYRFSDLASSLTVPTTPERQESFYLMKIGDQTSICWFI